MKIKVKDLNQTPVLYLYRCMNIEVLSYTDYPKIYYYWAENEEEALKQLLSTLEDIKEVGEFSDYDVERVWANGVDGGYITN